MCDKYRKNFGCRDEFNIAVLVSNIYEWIINIKINVNSMCVI